jgi:hypothetical protein
MIVVPGHERLVPWTHTVPRRICLVWSACGIEGPQCDCLLCRELKGMVPLEATPPEGSQSC